MAEAKSNDTTTEALRALLNQINTAAAGSGTPNMWADYRHIVRERAQEALALLDAAQAEPPRRGCACVAPVLIGGVCECQLPAGREEQEP